jgi:hypothetical protein
MRNQLRQIRSIGLMTLHPFVEVILIEIFDTKKDNFIYDHKESNYWCYWQPISMGLSLRLTTDSESVSLSWNKPLIWGIRPDFYYCQTVSVLWMWGALSDKRMGLSFTILTGRRQRSHFWIRVPWDSWLYFTSSDSRLPFLSLPTTLRATVEIFDPASTLDYWADKEIC